MSEHPKARLQKMCNNEGRYRRKTLEQRKRKQILKTFSLKNIKLAKQFWIELINLEIHPDISFVDYVSEDHTYKVKPQYLEIVQKLISNKIARFGTTETIINVPDKYKLTSLSLQNFLERNYY